MDGLGLYVSQREARRADYVPLNGATLLLTEPDYLAGLQLGKILRR